MTKRNCKVIATAMQSKKPYRKGLTTAEFIARAKKAHGNKYSYAKTEYQKAILKVCIICPVHGEFWQRAAHHMDGRGCDMCSGSAKRDTSSFVVAAKKKHGDRYDYSLVRYTASMQKVKIICRKHGVFEQTPTGHLVGMGCIKCGGSARMTTAEFIEKARSVHGDKYDYKLAQYTSNKSKVKIICKEHGMFEQVATYHTTGKGCPTCGNRAPITNEKFIKRARKIHGDKYDYSLTDYRYAVEKVKIICKQHGVFEQVPSAHIGLKSGCPECAKNSRGAYKRERYIQNCKAKHDGLSRLYVVKVVNSAECFYKVGITVQRLTSRLAPSQFPYEYEVVALIEESAEFIWDLETQIHRLLRYVKYRPKIPFAGRYECFSSIPKEVYKLLDNLEQSSQLPLIA